MGTVESSMALDAPYTVVLSWLVTYLIHSTLILGGVWLASRCAIFKSWPVRDSLWKLGLAGGVITATLQVVSGLALSTPEAESNIHGLRGKGESRHAEASLSPSISPEKAPSATEPTWEGIVGLDVPADPALEGDQALLVGPQPKKPLAAPVVTPAVVTVERPVPTVTRSWLPTLVAVLFGLWAVVAIWRLGRLLAARLHLRRVLGTRHPVTDAPLLIMLRDLTEGTPRRRRIKLTWSLSLPSPVCLGTREICLPMQALMAINRQEQEAMLAHEVAHLLRHDPAWLFFCGLLQSLLFFQPLNQIALRRYQTASEILCDDWAASRMGHGLHLATCLAEVAGWLQASSARTAPLPSMAQEGSDLVSRVERLLDGAPRPARCRSVKRMAVAAGTLVLVAGLAPGLSPGSLTPHHPILDEARIDSAVFAAGVRLKISTSTSDILLVRTADGKVSAALNGRPLPAEHLVLRESLVTILDTDGDLRFHVGLPGDGGFSFDATSLNIISGFDTSSNRYLARAIDPIHLECTDSGGTITLQLEDQQILAIDAQGPLALERRQRTSESGLRLVGVDGTTTLEIHLSDQKLKQAPSELPSAFIGVTLGPVSEALAAQIGCEVKTVSLVTSVAPRLAAARSGLKRFDILTHLDGRASAGPKQLGGLLARKHPGAQVFIRVLRAGSPRDLVVALPSATSHWNHNAPSVAVALAEYARWFELHRAIDRGNRSTNEDRSENVDDEEDREALVTRAEELERRAVRAATESIRSDQIQALRRFRAGFSRKLESVLDAVGTDLNARLQALGVATPGDSRLAAGIQDLQVSFEILKRSALADAAARIASRQGVLMSDLDNAFEQERRMSPDRLRRQYQKLDSRSLAFAKRLQGALVALERTLAACVETGFNTDESTPRMRIRTLALALTLIELEGEER